MYCQFQDNKCKVATKQWQVEQLVSKFEKRKIVQAHMKNQLVGAITTGMEEKCIHEQNQVNQNQEKIYEWKWTKPLI